ncbi:MAG: FdtA/QdtA family cupin domain-containing protein [Patescibacteria group bacterium]
MHIERVKLQSFDDTPDGELFIAEGTKNIPFAIKRVYYINQLDNPKAVRGKHAHKKLDQAIFCVNGSFVIDLDDGKEQTSITLDASSPGVLLPPMMWHTMHDFSKNCALLVLASDFFDESDYIRKHDEFLALCA